MTDYTKTIVDVSTGEVTIVPLSDEEIIEIQSRTPAKYVPEIISDRQFFQQAAISGLITQAEALAAVKTGDIPATLQAIVDSITDVNEKFAAEMLLSGATTFDRLHPLTEVVRVSLSWTPEQIDQFFTSAAQL